MTPIRNEKHLGVDGLSRLTVSTVRWVGAGINRALEDSGVRSRWQAIMLRDWGILRVL